MNFGIGLVIAVGSILGGYAALGGHIEMLVQPYEFVIIGGAALGIFVVANTTTTIRDCGRAFFEAVLEKAPKPRDYLDVLSVLHALMRELRAKSRSEVEGHFDKPAESEIFRAFPKLVANKDLVTFICDYGRLIIIGNARPHEIEALMDEEIETLAHDRYKPSEAFQSVADGLPALGIVAAVLGIIHAMSSILSVVLRSARLAVANLDGGGDQRLVMNTPALAASLSADIGLVHLDMFTHLAADPVLIGAHHAGAQLVQDAKRRLVARQAELPLELHRRHALRLTGDQIGGPKPHAQWRMTALHDRADRQSGVLATLPAAQDARPVIKAERFSAHLTVRANEPFIPAGLLQIRSAGRVVREKTLELRKRPGEGQAGVVANIHAFYPSCTQPGRQMPRTPAAKSRSSGCGRQPDRHAPAISFLPASLKKTSSGLRRLAVFSSKKVTTWR